jgi:hypothetical protein
MNQLKEYQTLYYQICRATKTPPISIDKLPLNKVLNIINTLLSLNNCIEITDREIENILEK